MSVIHNHKSSRSSSERREATFQPCNHRGGQAPRFRREPLAPLASSLCSDSGVLRAASACYSLSGAPKAHLLKRFSSLFHGVRALSLEPLALLLLPLSPTAPDPASARLRGPAQRCACGPDSPGSPVPLKPSRPRAAPSAAPPLAGGPSPVSCRMRGLSTTLLEAALACLSLVPPAPHSRARAS